MKQNIYQNTPEWHEQRLGKFTASQIYQLCKNGRKKGEMSKTTLSYIREIIAERITGEATPVFENDAMRWGTEQEPHAIAKYEQVSGNKVTQTGFIPLAGYEDYAGASPDGLVHDGDGNGIIEVKCPYTTKMHVETIETNDLPEFYKDKYYGQIQANLVATGASFCDFVSYDPRVKDEDFQIVVVRFYRDAEYIHEKLLPAIQQAVDYMNNLGFVKKVMTQ